MDQGFEKCVKDPRMRQGSSNESRVEKCVKNLGKRQGWRKAPGIKKTPMIRRSAKDLEKRQLSRKAPRIRNCANDYNQAFRNESSIGKQGSWNASGIHNCVKNHEMRHWTKGSRKAPTIQKCVKDLKPRQLSRSTLYLLIRAFHSETFPLLPKISTSSFPLFFSTSPPVILSFFSHFSSQFFPFFCEHVSAISHSFSLLSLVSNASFSSNYFSRFFFFTRFFLLKLTIWTFSEEKWSIWTEICFKWVDLWLLFWLLSFGL